MDTRRTMLLFASVVLLVAIPLVGFATFPEEETPVLGWWESTDLDGSHQVMNIQAGRIDITDDGASVCRGARRTGASLSPVFSPYLMRDRFEPLFGRQRVFASMAFWCEDQSQGFGPMAWRAQYVSEDLPEGVVQTLTDMYGVVWTRQGLPWR